MDVDRWLTLLRRDGERLAAVAADHLEARVPACPGWSVRDAVVHTGEVYSHKTETMRLGRWPEHDEWHQEPGEGEDPVAWFCTRLEELLGQLTSRAPQDHAVTWWESDQTVRFWCRRMAQETAVHRADVESAVEAMTPIDDELAIDGVDEVLDAFLAGDWSSEPIAEAAGKVVAVRTGEHAWLVTLQPELVRLDRRVGASDALVSGEPSELLLWLWGRRPQQAVTAEGDHDVLQAFRRRLVSVTQ
jgi:uncharacterized protein (TIGR03083 family)